MINGIKILFVVNKNILRILKLIIPAFDDIHLRWPVEDTQVIILKNTDN